MKRPLFTQSLNRIKDSGLYSILIFGMLLFVGSGNLFAQGPGNPLDARTNLPIASSECNCLDNATTPLNGVSNGQYSEQIIINQAPPPGQMWTIISATGFYSPSSPAPPAAPVSYMLGTSIPETGMGTGVFILDGIRVSGQAWTVVFTDGTTHYTISSLNACAYPSLASVGISGPRSLCTADDATYSISAPLGNTDDLFWTVVGGNIINGQGTTSISVAWPGTPGAGSVTVSGFLRSYPTQVDPCEFINTIQVSVVNSVAEVMACNNLVNISMNPSCEMYITPEMILQDMDYDNDAYDVILTDLSNNHNIPLGTLGYGYINKIIKVEIFNACSGNSCWGYAKIEDKSIPDLICPDDVTVDCDEPFGPADIGYPFGIGFNTANITSLGGGRYKVINFDPCSDITVQYVDAVVFNNCSNPFSSVITRTWLATDNSGNTTTCSHVINVRRALLSGVTFPSNYDDVLGPNPSIEACSNYPTFPATHEYFGHPHPDFTGYPQGIICLSATVDYTDTKLGKCGDKSFKILRRWRVIDHCTPPPAGILNFTQTITVMDRTPPALVGIDEFEVGTSTFVCGGIIDLPPLTLSTPECSTWDYTVAYKPADSAGAPTGNFITTGVVRLTNGNYRINSVITGFPRVWIRYTATDACGNSSFIETEVDIIDTERPVPVCDKNSVVSLGEDGMAFAGVGTFDDGSWDNCGIYDMKVARMDASTCTDTEFRDEVKFCCSDIGTKVRVILRITDLSDNQNECMVETEVQDNIPPVWINFPRNLSFDCSDDLSDTTRFGIPLAEDNCNVALKVRTEDRRNECGTGEIWRIWTATDNYNNSIERTQIITVRDNTPFVRGNISFPMGPVTINGCTSKPVLPEDLPAGRRRPTWSGDDCAQVAADYEDVIFQYTNEACVKILRKWTVIDWCQRDDVNPLLPKSWSEFQVIMVNDNQGPTITFGHRPADLTVTPVGVCSANVSVTARANDVCTAENKLVWTWAIDLGNNNSVDFSGNGNSINRTFQYGTHKITWTVKDECGNTRTEPNVFTLVDTKPPTPYCITDIVTVIMPSTENVTIWASDYDLGSLDNCTAVTASFSPTNRNMISRTITCDEMTESTTEFNIKVYFIDVQGNSDFCTVKLHVQDNNNTCGLDANGGGPSQRINISGNVFQSNMMPMEDIDIQLNADLPEFPLSKSTNLDGNFVFSNLAKDNDYIVNPILNKDHDNGVSTLDLVLIQRHILGIEFLNSPYKVIASDVTNDMKVNTLDLVELRKVILGVQDEFSNNNSWRFAETSQTMDPKFPFPFIEKMKMSKLDYSIGGIDFIGVKVGDVNESVKMNAKSNEVDTRSVTSLSQNKITGKAGEIVEVTIGSEEIQKLFGWQMSLYLPAEIGSFEDIYSNTLRLGEDNVAWNQSDAGILNISWNSQNETDLVSDAITIKVKLNKDINNTQLLGLLDGGLNPEIYTQEGNTVKAKPFRFTSSETVVEEFELFQNVPNPFSGKTTIGFHLPQESDVTITVYDVTGKVLLTQSAFYGKGRHNVDIDIQRMGIDGLLYYRLDTKTNSAVKRMIAIK
ncbi:MAG: T9SS type A sorting domain-containing protein [Saprospiraceae bacterium]|nr:T9SS type A sorting domain-containing protein [Saprospiraceae bacterium]